MFGRFLPAITIFWGSFLLFGVQPMVGRTLLPAFGGTAAVWVVCLCAFQVLLLAGYFQAHFASHGNPSRQKAHLCLLGLSACWAFLIAKFSPAFLHSLGNSAVPALEVLGAVLVLAGFPYVMLSANSSLVQAWVAHQNDRSVYRLYAVSNAGSFAGLFAYPFLLEPYVSLTWQWAGFAVGVVVYTLLLAVLYGRRAENSAPAAAETVASAPAVASSFSRLLWIALPAFSCFLLNALTVHLTLDVMPMPLLWTATLGLFLLSYMIGFSGWTEKRVKPLGLLALALLCAVCWMNGKTIRQVSLPVTLGIYGAFLLTGCSFLHAWLYAVRPAASLLTRYYLFGALGGAIGGILASLVAPACFHSVLEYPIALVLVGLAGIVAVSSKTQMKRNFLCMAGGVALCAGAIFLFQRGAGQEQRPVVYRGRGFFGTIEVLEAKARTGSGEGYIREFVHGTTIHGIQAILPGKERMPTTYYTPNASGYAIVGHPKYRTGEPMRVNITGLGIGVLFCYGRTNDTYRAYEISQNALNVATNPALFTFVSACPAKKEIVLGDARKGLERELAAGVEPYDVIVVDAFTGDNLPYHLSTREAFELYFKLLKPDGILCVNISNWHLTLEPFMRTIGDTFQVPLLGLQTADDFARLAFGSKVAFFCRKPEGLAQPPLQAARLIDFNRFRPMPALPTDEKGSFIDLINW